MELFRFGVHVLHEPGLAEEMVQETFIKFCQQARNYDANRGQVAGRSAPAGAAFPAHPPQLP
jgi:DNA-directed RNA polymerase specialized sigma24 family protein